MDFQAIHAGQFPLVRPAKRFKGAAPGSFLEALETALPVVAEQTFLQRHAGQLLRFLNLYRAGTPVTRKRKDATVKDLVRPIYIYIHREEVRDGCALVTRIANARSFAETKLVAKAFWRDAGNARCACIFFLGREIFLANVFSKVLVRRYVKIKESLL